ncbi:MAG: adenylate kinase [Candidatus Omnitrophica bacterium]|nr:adenylate kinase [Candidatus Omnitrophota bacterium]MBU1048139.1 adenylate kinase [Candidatus Omnitrophota bacterium]MBU1630734.1 adenylate kinase [Candidatus Omnitrophota bacterium]MBU1889234.1 adenylate kinase [Candidatus Omnitrophota bacterium]
MKILIMGPPGAGKGTIAEMLQENFDVVHLSSGDILRDAIKENNPLGMKAKAFMEKGVLVPDEIIIEIMKEKINADAFVLDGFPRNLVQVKKLEDADIKIDIVLNLQVSEETVISRISGRRICAQCGKIYHLKNMPPKKEDICDVCNGKLYQREDDKPQTIKERLNTYREQTEELVKYYDEKNILENIDAGGNKETTYDKITGLEWLKKRKYKSKAGL